MATDNVIKAATFKKFKGNIEDVKLTHVESGDQNNNLYYNFFSTNLEAKAKWLNALCNAKDGINTIVALIFEENISDDQFIKIVTALTFFDSTLELSGGHSVINNANDLFFALLVNYNCNKNNATSNMKIKSISALVTAREFASDRGRNLDYSEYIINGNPAEFDETANGKFEKVWIDLPFCNAPIELKVPIIKLKLGAFKLATNKVAALIQFFNDKDNAEYLIPSYVWLPLVQEKLNSKRLAKFLPFERRSLEKYFKFTPQVLDEILRINNFNKVNSFMNEAKYNMEYTEDMCIRVRCKEEPFLASDNQIVVWGKFETYCILMAPAKDDFYISIERPDSIDIYVN